MEKVTVVSTVDTGSGGLDSRPYEEIEVYLWAGHSAVSRPRYTQEYNWLLENCQGSQTKKWGGRELGVA